LAEGNGRICGLSNHVSTSACASKQSASLTARAPTILPMPATADQHTWVLTASPENHAATREHGFSVIGIKERNRTRALQIEPGDRIVLYLTKVMAFAGSILVTGEMYEDRTKIWPGKPGKADAYPWRFPTKPEIVLEDDEWVPAEKLRTEMEHIRKWPAEHWKLAFQGQLRTISDADTRLLLDRMGAAAAARA
jgi:EVE domain